MRLGFRNRRRKRFEREGFMERETMVHSTGILKLCKKRREDKFREEEQRASKMDRAENGSEDGEKLQYGRVHGVLL